MTIAARGRGPIPGSPPRCCGAACQHEQRSGPAGETAAPRARPRRAVWRAGRPRRRAPGARRSWRALGADRGDPTLAVSATPGVRRGGARRARPIDPRERHRPALAGAAERRWRAAQRVGLHEVPVIIRQLGDAEALEIALVENLQREDLSPLEEAEAYSRLTR